MYLKEWLSVAQAYEMLFMAGYNKPSRNYVNLVLDETRGWSVCSLCVVNMDIYSRSKFFENPVEAVKYYLECRNS